MPIIRKIMDLRTCKAVTIPISWLRYYEEKRGKPIKFVAMEVNTEIKIIPYFPEDQKE